MAYKEGRAEGRTEGREEGRVEGIEQERYAIVIKTLQKFPEWSDAEVAEFVGVQEPFVQELRHTLEKGK